MDDRIACDDIGVHINRIGWLHDHNLLVPAEQIEDISQLVAGAAGNKYLLRRKVRIPLFIVSGNGPAELRITAFRHIPMERGFDRLVVYGLVKGLDHRVAEGQGHVADAHAVQIGPGMLLQIRLCLLCDMVKQIGIL